MFRGWWQVVTLGFALQGGCNQAPEFRNGGKQAQPQEEESLDAEPSQLTESFPLYDIARGQVKWDPTKHDQVTQTLTLNQPNPSRLETAQMERTLLSVTAYQGHDGDEVDETFDVWELGKLDILIVVDNSQSMGVYQDQLASRLDSLLSEVGNTNWRIGFVTTDNYCVRDVIHRSDFASDPTATNLRFQAAVTAGEEGHNIERGIEMAVKGFRQHGECPTVAGVDNNAWYRDGSDKVVLIISDEENCGSADNEIYCEEKDGEVFEKWFPEHFEDFVEESGAMVFGLLDAPECGHGWSRQPEHYRKIMHCSRSDDPSCWDEDPPESGTGWFPICSDNYDGVLNQISSDVSNIVHQDFDLKGSPEPGSLSIEVDDVPLETGYSVSGDLVSIEKGILSDSDDLIRFQYRYNAVERTDRVSLAGQSVDWRTVRVTINDKDADQDSYQAIAANDAVVFNELPPDRAALKVYYRENSELPQRFALGQDVIADSIVVTVDGDAASDVSFDTSTFEVIFQEAPMDGRRVDIDFMPIAKLQTDFDGLLFADGNLAEVGASSGSDGRGISVIYDAGFLEFDPEDVYGQDQLTVSYYLELEPEEYRLPLPQEAFEVSVHDGSGESVEACRSLGMVEYEAWIDVSCLKHRSRAAVVEYSFVEAQNQRFRLPGGMQHEDVVLEVRLDGEPFYDFEIVDGFLVIGELSAYPIDAQIQVFTVLSEGA